MSKLYKIDGSEYISKDTVTLPDGRVHSGKTFNRNSERLFSAEELEDRGVTPVAHVPEKRVQKVKTKNTPTSLRKLKEEDDGGQ
jgi:hypothetical protein